MHSHYTAVLDSCVLFPATTRNILLQVAFAGIFRARWSREILDEAKRSMLEKYPDMTVDAIAKREAQMGVVGPDCLVTEHEGYIDAIDLPDAKDRHVVAAAIRCNADVIVTLNLKDFPDSVLRRYGIHAQHPDDFLMHTLDIDPIAVCTAVRSVRQRLKKPAYTVSEFIGLLRDRELSKTAEYLRQYELML